LGQRFEQWGSLEGAQKGEVKVIETCLEALEFQDLGCE
jgi:hypothetical protein